MRAWIPPNFTDNGNWFGGLIKKRNAVEAGVFLSAFLFFLKIVVRILGGKAALVLVITLGLPITLFLLVGLGGESVGSFLLDVIRYRRNRRVVTIKMPTADLPSAKDRKRSKKDAF